MSALLFGAAIGFSVAAPVGPIGLLCIRASLDNGPRAGFAAGLGAAIADASYAAVCVFAIGFVTHLVRAAAIPLHVIGSVAVIAIGVRTLVQNPRPRGATTRTEHSRIFRTTLLLTLANPTTLLSFAAIVAGAALGSQAMTMAAGFALIAGVFCGSAMWWLVLAVAIGAARRAMTSRMVAAISRVSGVVLCAVGTTALVR